MSDTLIITGIAISLIAPILRLMYGIKQMHERQHVKDIPLRLQEWHARYKTNRGYLRLLQIAGILLIILGLSI